MNPEDAWRPWAPSAREPWDVRRAAHLYRRAAFGADWRTLQWALTQRPIDVLDRLIEGGDETGEFYRAVDEKSAQISERDLPDSTELRGLWLERLLHSPHPLLEKMTLFWHNHFATSFAKVRRVRLMQKQNDVLRRGAFGKLGDLLLGISKDPAMLIWLDSTENVKGRPNENYAREILEAFTLGHGNFTEKDVQEAARAFTGWRQWRGGFRLDKSAHDYGAKTVFGKTGPWNGDDVVRIILEQPAAPRFLVRKLFRFFISEAEDPPPALIEPLAVRLRESDYDVGQVVNLMLRSQLFFSEMAYRRRVKSPVEYVLGMANHLRGGGVTVSPYSIVGELDELGQTLYSPPNVFGWQGGHAWIGSSTLLARQNLAFEFALDPFRADDPADLVERNAGGSPHERIAFLASLLLDGQIGDQARRRLTRFLAGADGADPDPRQRIREATHLIMLLPEYQLA